MTGSFKDREHVLRMAGLFAAGISVFLVLRYLAVPADFGLYGHYRAGAIADNQNRPLVYAGQQACLDCHADVAEMRQAGAHAKVACETCHGPLAAHAEAKSDQKPGRPDPRVTCLRCHEARAGRPKAVPQIVPAEHAPEGSCAGCHRPHAPGIS